MTAGWRWLSACVLVALAAAGCGTRRRAGAGVACELNSDCAAPLVCRLGACRNECATSGDCAEGLSCVLDQSRLGACQLATERDCLLDSACPAPLVCRLMQCVNECVSDRDCLGGARCEVGPMGGACIDVAGTPCVLDGDCESTTVHLFCLAGRCRAQCFTNRDCRRDLVCDLATNECVRGDDDDAGPAPDAGAIDAGGADAPSGSTIRVEIVHVGSISGALAGLPCSNPSFGDEIVECTTAPFTGTVVLTASPDGTFGYTRTTWTGCASVTPPASCTVTAPGVVRACFHDGSATGIAGCMP